ncbi:MAG: hypothetical protein PHU85_20755, partial [Phycisphaerae bacterium]|nr:hypothetical protein [Phycisphaerae bacterium]
MMNRRVYRTVVLALLGMLLLGSSAGADAIISGVGTTTDWNAPLDKLYQYTVASNGTVTTIGNVNLDTLLGYTINAKDIAMLAGGRVAVLHRNAGNNASRVTVLTPQYTGGLLTGVSSYVTLNSSVSNFATISIAPTGNGGFAVCGNSQPSVYFYTPSGSTFT